jgi:hypothetical protein
LFGPLHLQTLIGKISVKIVMSIRSSIRTFGDATKAIQVELPLKGRQFGMTEISWQHRADKGIGISNHKGISLGQESNNTLIFLFEHFHKFSGEWIRVSSGG